MSSGRADRQTCPGSDEKTSGDQENDSCLPPCGGNDEMHCRADLARSSGADGFGFMLALIIFRRAKALCLRVWPRCKLFGNVVLLMITGMHISILAMAQLFGLVAQ